MKVLDQQVNTVSKNSESLPLDLAQIQALKKLVHSGEGYQLEFKRKAAHPDKIAKELIAFANSDGGIMLIGVDDDKSIPGLKYPEEESHAIHDILEKHCRPKLVFSERVIRLSEKNFVLHLDIPKSSKSPHYFVVGQDRKDAFIRVDDKCIKASREMREIIRRSRSKTGVKFIYGEKEDQLIKYLNQIPSISLDEYKQMAELNRSTASKKLVLLVLGHVLKITPTEKGDLYSRL